MNDKQREALKANEFPKGKSGNPGGRPKNDGWFRRMCRKRTVKALAALTKALEDPSTRVSAAKVLLEFGWGKTPQVVRLPEDGDPETGVPTADEAAAAAARLRERAH